MYNYNVVISDQLLLKEGSWRRKITVERANKGNHLDVYLISEDWGKFL